MPATFHDSLLQRDFDHKGYVLIPGLISAENINNMLSLFESFQKDCTGPFHTSHFSSDAVYKRQVHDTIVKNVFPLVGSYLIDFVPLFGNFMIKNPDPHVGMDLHADWTYVDEHKFRSAAIWVPLVDTNERNGCLGVIEGSHKITNAIRGPMIRQLGHYDKKWERSYGTLLPMRAGDAIVYDHGLLHYSPPNQSDRTRPALNLSMSPAAAAPWRHYCRLEGAEEIEVYRVDDPEFYIRYTHFQRPERGVLIDKLSPATVGYTDAALDRYWKTRMIDKVKALFGSA